MQIRSLFVARIFARFSILIRFVTKTEQNETLSLLRPPTRDLLLCRTTICLPYVFEPFIRNQFAHLQLHLHFHRSISFALVRSWSLPLDRLSPLRLVLALASLLSFSSDLALYVGHSLSLSLSFFLIHEEEAASFAWPTTNHSEQSSPNRSHASSNSFGLLRFAWTESYSLIDVAHAFCLLEPLPSFVGYFLSDRVYLFCRALRRLTYSFAFIRIPHPSLPVKTLSRRRSQT
jgi:hypothetical protein